MDGLDKILQENQANHRYQVLKVDFNPNEKANDPRVYGAIWFDREAAPKDVLKESGIDGEMILILDKAYDDNAGFRFTFSLIGAAGVEWVPSIEVGSLYQIAGSFIGGVSQGKGKIEFYPIGGASGDIVPCASLGFFSEFPAGVGKAEPKRHAMAYVKTYENDITYDEYEIVLKESTLQTVIFQSRLGAQPPSYLLEYDGVSWNSPSRFMRFRDYDQRGNEEIQKALASQCDEVTLIYGNKRHE